jgi:hypothetical protein
MPRTVLLKAETHTLYAARAESPLYHKSDDKKGGNFTLHHIIPYRYPFFIGFVFEQLIRTFPAWSTVPGGSGKELRRRMLAVYNRLVPHNAVTDTTLFALNAAGDRAPNLRVGHHFAWMGVNLFVGPSGAWRMDDPHEGEETIKPQSFDAGRWGALHALKRFLDTYAYEFNDAAKTVTTIEIVLEEGNFVSSLLGHLEGLAGYGRDAHPFTPTDWIILDSEHPAWGMAQKALSATLTRGGPAQPDDVKISDAKALFQRIIDEDKTRPESAKVVELLAPSQHRNVTFAGRATPDHWGVMWRLRLDGEAIPAAKFKANFQLQ